MDSLYEEFSMWDFHYSPIQWTGRDYFLSFLRQKPRDMDTIVVENISFEDLVGLLSRADEKNSEHPRFTVLLYNRSISQAIIRLPSRVQATAAHVFRSVLEGTRKFGTRAKRRPSDSTPSSARLITKSYSHIIQPDMSATPSFRHAPQEHLTHTSPSAMVVIGVTQTYQELKAVVQQWFDATNRQVRIIILIKVRQRPMGNHVMLFEKWRCAPDGKPFCETAISVQIRDGVGSRCYYGSSDLKVTTSNPHMPFCMVLEFELLCERSPLYLWEKDIYLGEHVFRDIAAETFVEMRPGRA